MGRRVRRTNRTPRRGADRVGERSGVGYRRDEALPRHTQVIMR
jgi:hypothetical protein